MASSLKRGWIDGQEAIIDRFAPDIEDHFVERKRIQHLMKLTSERAVPSWQRNSPLTVG